jgi:hypothetical protein
VWGLAASSIISVPEVRALKQQSFIQQPHNAQNFQILRRNAENDKFFISSKYIVDKELVGPTPYVLFMLSKCTIYYDWQCEMAMPDFYGHRCCGEGNLGLCKGVF